ncbi:hypothetical protein DVH24_040080 [Malus domestica]|uniref:Uncharacterized protein n=1 Tax=Malus domestica TaxID=3750 RepID=A0A498I5C8_MALDO|nr:hypothetical protein DVH24_040080 [Malus domestica]
MTIVMATTEDAFETAIIDRVWTSVCFRESRIIVIVLFFVASASTMGTVPSCQDIMNQLTPCISYLLAVMVCNTSPSIQTTGKIGGLFVGVSRVQLI